MKKHLIVLGFLSVLLIGNFSGCIGPEVTEPFNGEYPVDAQTIVSVSNINGRIQITGWAGDSVAVSAVKKSTSGDAGLRNINISITHTGKTIAIETKYTGQPLTQFGVDYSIKIPYNTTLASVTTSNGAIQVSNVKGNLTATSSNGAVTIEAVRGTVSATTSNAQIEIQEVTGVGTIRSSNAAINAEVRSIQDDVDIETSNAAVTVYVNPSINASFEMTTSNAKIHLQGLTLTTSLLEDTHVIGTLGTDGHRIDIRTSNAAIYLYNWNPSG